MPSTRPAPPEAAAADAASTGKRLLKKYPNRRLYDTQTSSYITLADVKHMVLKSDEFEVRDAKTGEDLTRSILLQIILEEESGGVPLFTTQMLSQIIRFYGHAMQGLMGEYMQRNLEIFSELQQRVVAQSQGLVEGKPFAAPEWTQALGGSAGSLMAGYLDQSRVLFEQMQEQMRRSGSLFPMPGFPPKK